MNREIEIYSGLRTLGILRQRGDRWEAFNEDFKALGAFPTQEKAEAAIHEAIRLKNAARAG